MTAALPGGELAAGLEQGLAGLGLAITASQQAQLLQYLSLIQKWNKVYNLTAVRDPAEMLTHHLLDSLAVVPALAQQMADGAVAKAPQILDVGAGAGLPGIVLAICLPEASVSCVDTVAKKATFVQQVALTLKLPNLKGVHARVENLAGPFDVITSRAFASLPDFVSWSGGALAEQGVWMALKGKMPDAEIAALPPAVDVFHVEQLTVPGLDAQRCVVWMRKKPIT